MKDIIERKLPGIPTNTKKMVNIFVESVRALARNSITAEQMYLASKQQNVHIQLADYPNLFKHNQSPTESFVRKLICNLQELDRDTLVYRLAHGREEKKKRTSRLTQHGAPKANGCQSWLEKLKPNKVVKRKIQGLGKSRAAGKFGWRPMAEKVSKLLKLNRVLSHECVRRMLNELGQDATLK